VTHSEKEAEKYWTIRRENDFYFVFGIIESEAVLYFIYEDLSLIVSGNDKRH
jgi:hypothetical protein